MSDFNAAYSYQPASYNQQDYQSQGNGQPNQYDISDQAAYDNFFQRNGITASDEQKQNTMDFADSLGFSKGSPLGAEEFGKMGDLISGRANINTMQETGELGPNVNHAQADGCMGRFKGGGSAGSNSGSAGSNSGSAGSVSTTGASGVSTGSNGELVLGNTTLNINGGSELERSLIEENFTAMYNNDPAFKAVIDSKASTGINLDFTEYTDNTAGMAEVGGSNMWMDISYLNSNPDAAGLAEVIAHEVGHLSGLDHGAELDAFAKTAGQSVLA